MQEDEYRRSSLWGQNPALAHHEDRDHVCWEVEVDSNSAASTRSSTSNSSNSSSRSSGSAWDQDTPPAASSRSSRKQQAKSEPCSPNRIARRNGRQSSSPPRGFKTLAQETSLALDFALFTFQDFILEEPDLFSSITSLLFYSPASSASDGPSSGTRSRTPSTSSEDQPVVVAPLSPTSLSSSPSGAAKLKGEEKRKLCIALLNVLRSHGRDSEGLGLVKTAITRLLPLTDSQELLLRDENLLVWMLSEYLKLEGKDLLEPLRPILEEVTSAQSLSCEVDFSRGNVREEDQLRNLSNLQKLTQHILTAILSSHVYLSGSLKELCHFLHAKAEECFPGSGRQALGGLLFLRFFCPAIVSPSFVGADNLSAEARRSLVLVAKIIQSVVNETPFQKEIYVLPFNALVEQYIARVHAFYDILLSETATFQPPPPSAEVGEDPSENSEHLLALFTIVRDHVELLKENATPPLRKIEAETLEILIAEVVRAMNEEEQQSQQTSAKGTGNVAKKAALTSIIAEEGAEETSQEEELEEGHRLNKAVGLVGGFLKTTSRRALNPSSTSPARSKRSRSDPLLLKENVEEWNKTAVGMWLATISQEQHVELFRQNNITGKVLVRLDKERLLGLGVTSLGDRMKISSSIAKLQPRNRGSSFDTCPEDAPLEMTLTASWFAKDLQVWTLKDIKDWLSNFEDLAEYYKLFKKHKLTGQQLSEQTVESLRELGVSKHGHRMKIVKMVRELSQDPLVKLHNKSVQRWTLAELNEWLYAIELGEYVPVFAQQAVKPGQLLHIKESDLLDIGITILGHRKKFMKQLEILKAKKKERAQEKRKHHRPASSSRSGTQRHRHHHRGQHSTEAKDSRSDGDSNAGSSFSTTEGGSLTHHPA